MHFKMLSSALLVTISSTLFPSAFAIEFPHYGGGGYNLRDDLSFENFFRGFDFFSAPDPTKGFVQYQNETSSITHGLVGFLDDTMSVFFGAEFRGTDPRGRKSVRLESKKVWNRGLLIADIRHMPASVCGSWPAFWMLGASDDWPKGGEIDILEGVHEQDVNKISMHTSEGCIVDNVAAVRGKVRGNTTLTDEKTPSFYGTMTTENCYAYAEGQPPNSGCSISAPQSLPGDMAPLSSYGTQFNRAGGGVYALEWSSTNISVWFFSRSSPHFASYFPPSNSSTAAPEPSNWGAPMARFAGNCNVDKHFKDMKIIFDITFCGDWAGAEWDRSGCKAKTGTETCEAYVRDNPAVFEGAYWEVAGLRWYQHE